MDDYVWFIIGTFSGVTFGVITTLRPSIFIFSLGAVVGMALSNKNVFNIFNWAAFAGIIIGIGIGDAIGDAIKGDID